MLNAPSSPGQGVICHLVSEGLDGLLLQQAARCLTITAPDTRQALTVIFQLPLNSAGGGDGVFPAPGSLPRPTLILSPSGQEHSAVNQSSEEGGRGLGVSYLAAMSSGAVP